ncbi:MAG: CidA/LrgA family protein [Hyphomicrobiales bacterium]|nr:MAG: CidA/LrgA family protein [Hyphomicrobiales bacterium]
MLNSITLILCCQLVGELLSKFLALPAPGPVIGMVLLFVLLLLRGGISKSMANCADGLLNHLSLLFVPAGVGVMLHFRLLGQDWLAVSVALLVSTLLTITVTGLMMNWLGKSKSDQKPDSKTAQKGGHHNG